MLAIITGSGFYELDGLRDPTVETVPTEWGSAQVTRGRWATNDAPVLFLARHGSDHSIAPHLINYRANVAALAEAGATAIVSTAVSGGIADGLDPGTFVVIDDFLDMTSGRPLTFFDAPGSVQHTDVSDPYDPALRAALVASAADADIEIRNGGVYAATNGPRFETRAEIRALQAMGADLVGMTGCPEVVLANELGLAYGALGVIVNRAVGLADVELSLDEIWAVVADAKPQGEAILSGIIESWGPTKPEAP